MIQISSNHLNQIRNHAENTYPEECCGLLLGQINDHYKILIEVRETENSWSVEAFDFLTNLTSSSKPLSKQNRFSIAPEMLLKVQKEARDRALSIIGIYHSHPDHPAIPSKFDQAIAHALYSYIIVSVQQGQTKDISSWILDEMHQFQQEEIINTT